MVITGLRLDALESNDHNLWSPCTQAEKIAGFLPHFCFALFFAFELAPILSYVYSQRLEADFLLHFRAQKTPQKNHPEAAFVVPPLGVISTHTLVNAPIRCNTPPMDVCDQKRFV